MKSFESVYKELEELFIQKLPEYIQKNNIEHNDTIILKSLKNSKLDEDCLRLPCYKFGFEESEYSEKDRIIENSIFKISLQIKLPQETLQKNIVFWRYVEAIQKLFEETETGYFYEIFRIKESKIIIKVTLCR